MPGTHQIASIVNAAGGRAAVACSRRTCDRLSSNNTGDSAVQIRAITAYQLDLPFRDGPYICSGGRSALGFETLIVRVDSDDGLAGWGEIAPARGCDDSSLPA